MICSGGWEHLGVWAWAGFNADGCADSSFNWWGSWTTGGIQATEQGSWSVYLGLF